MGATWTVTLGKKIRSFGSYWSMLHFGYYKQSQQHRILVIMSIQMTHKIEHCGPGVPIKECPDLLAILPEGHEYHVCWYVGVGEGKFKCELRLPITTAEDARAWIDQHKKKSQIVWRLKTTSSVTGKGTVLKTYYRCQHNTRPRSQTADKKPNSKNTNCLAQMTLTVKATYRKKSSDHHLPALPMIVLIEQMHNHPLTGDAKIMRHWDVSEDTIQKFKELFARGYTPSSALRMHKIILQMEHTTNYMHVVADRSLCPDLSFVYRLYAKVFQKRYGADSGQALLTAVNKTEKHNGEQKMECVSMEQVKETVIANDSADEFENPGVDEELTTLKMRLHNFVASLEKHLNENTNEYVSAVEAFLSKWEGIKTDTDRVLALQTFGKNHNSMPFSVVKKSDIKAQPRTVSCRRMPLGGRQCVQSDRPPKNHDTKSKSLKRSNSKDGSMHMMPKKQPRRAPHNLSECVLQHENIG